MEQENFWHIVLEAMWLLQWTRTENRTNKLYFRQGLGEFNPFLKSLMNSLLYNFGHDPRSMCATSSPWFPYTNHIAGCFLFPFLRTIHEKAIALGQISPDDSPMSNSEGMFLKVYNGTDWASKAFDVSSVAINSGFSTTGCCLSNATWAWKRHKMSWQYYKFA